MKVCPICFKEIEQNRFNSKTYCSEAHRKYAWKKRNWRSTLDYNNALARKKCRANWKEKICPYCKNKFFPILGNKNQQVYCSHYCKNKFNYNKQKETGRYLINKANYRKNNKEHIKIHDEEYKARIRFGAVSKTLNKRIVLERDNRTCQICKNPYQVIHHIRYSGKPEDLVCLCRACHASLHQRIKSEPYLLS